MPLETRERLVALWNNGAYCSIDQRHSLMNCSTFVGDLVDLTRQFGSPDSVEIRTEEVEVTAPAVNNEGVRPESHDG